MSTLVTKTAPDFTAKAVMGDNSIKEIRLSDYRGKYVILFFYPMDFTFVCPTEILKFNQMLDEFHKRGCEVIGVSTDSEYSHLAWKNTSVNEGGIGQIRYPLVADIKKEISRNFGILFDDSVALRATFLIDKEGIIRHAVINDLPLGRSVSEALRVLDALIYVEQHGEVCPAEWHPGEEAMRPDPKGVAEYLAKHVNN